MSDDGFIKKNICTREPELNVICLDDIILHIHRGISLFLYPFIPPMVPVAQTHRAAGARAEAAAFASALHCKPPPQHIELGLTRSF